MLPKRHRLSTEDFKEMRKMRAVHAPHFLVRIDTVPAKVPRVAVIVSSGAYKKAVDRNLLRRRMYNLARKHFATLPLAKCTVSMKKGALDVPFKELEREFVEVLKKS